MFDKDYILKELRNGRDYEEIMDEISNVLNEASAEFEKEEKARNKRQNKIEDMQEIIDLIHDYCLEYYCHSNEDINEIDDAFGENDAEKYVDLIDNFYELADSLTDLAQKVNLYANPKDEKKAKSVDPKGEIEIEVDLSNADKILSDFLKMFK